MFCCVAFGAVADNTAAAAKASRARVVLYMPPSVLSSESVSVSGQVSGKVKKKSRVVLQVRGTGKHWRSAPGASAKAKKGVFVLHWRTPAAPAVYRVRAVLKANHRFLTASSAVAVSVQTKPPGAAFNAPPPPTVPPSTPPPSGPPVTPPATYYLSQMTIQAGSEESVELPEGVTVDSADLSGPDAPSTITPSVDSGMLSLSAAANAQAAHHDLVIAAQGCNGEVCDGSIEVHLPVEVISAEAPPGELTDFPDPSPDRLQAASSIPGDLPGQRIADELVVTLGTETDPGTHEDADAVAAAVGAVVSGGISELGVYTVRWSTTQDIAARRTELLTLPGVTDVSYHDVGTVGADSVPSDWDDDGQEVTWPFTQIHAQQAWDTWSYASAKLGIVDVGIVQANHEDLNVWTTLGVAKPASHATHVAGLACAQANGIGLVGVAWGCPIVTTGIKSGSDLDVLEAAISVVAQSDVKVINMSLGLRLSTPRCATPAERDVLRTEAQRNSIWFRRLFNGATGKNIVWTLSAGNNCQDIASSAWGQNGDLPNVIVVGATNSDRSLATFSNYGPGVEVAAPGGVDLEPPRNGTVGLWSTWLYGDKSAADSACGPDYHYCWDYGTSMSAPIVAGIADLIRSRNSNFTAAQVAGCIVGTASGSAIQSAYPAQYDAHIPFSADDALSIVDAEAALNCDPFPPVDSLDESLYLGAWSDLNVFEQSPATLSGATANTNFYWLGCGGEHLPAGEVILKDLVADPVNKQWNGSTEYWNCTGAKTFSPVAAARVVRQPYSDQQRLVVAYASSSSGARPFIAADGTITSTTGYATYSVWRNTTTTSVRSAKGRLLKPSEYPDGATPAIPTNAR
jgi:hypothetical protein